MLHEVVTLVHKGVSRFHKYAHLINNIRDFLEEDLDVKIVHWLREGNMCVVLLAKQGVKQQETLFLQNKPSPALQTLLLADVSGVTLS